MVGVSVFVSLKDGVCDTVRIALGAVGPCVMRSKKAEAVMQGKAPSADLWAGQTDEDELGFTYEQADLLLHHMVDRGLDDGRLASLGFAPELVATVRDRVRAQAFKWLPVPSATFPGRPLPDLAGGF